MGDPEGLFHNIFSSLLDGVLLVSRDLTIRKGNLAIEELFCRSHDSFENRALSELIPDQPEVLTMVRRTLKTGTSFRDIPGVGFRKNGTTFPLSLTLSPLADPSGRPEGVVILVKDTSLLKELEETSRQFDRMSTMGALALGMAHEIKNPLGGIRGSAQLLLQELEDSQKREYLEVIIAEVDRINRMVTRMLDLTHPRRRVTRKTNIHKVLEEILVLEREAIDRKKTRFIQDYDPSLPQIDADEDQLKQVFLNLIQNALDAIPEGGGIRMVTRLGSNYAVKTARDEMPRQNIIVEVIDTGPGIREKDLHKLFTPFYTTKKKGSGLGLPISLKIVEDHGGKIKVLSQKGAGTTVQVFLPIQQK